MNVTFEEIEGVMKHELIHIWLNRIGYGEDSKNHGPRFKAKAEEIGAVLYAKSYAGISHRINYKKQGLTDMDKSFLRAHGYKVY